MKNKDYLKFLVLIPGMLLALSTVHANDLNWLNTYIGKGPDASYGSSTHIKMSPDSNLIAIIQFSDTLDIDPGPGVTNVIANSYNDILVAKFTPAGQMLWHFQIGTPNTGVSTGFNDFAIAANGGIYIVGSIQGVTDFDPSPADASQTPSGGHAPFIASYDANGNYLNAVLLSTTGGADIRHVAINSQGNVYICGDFTQDLDVDPSAGNVILSSYLGTTDAFLASYTAGLAYSASYQIATQCNCTEEFKSMVIDGLDNIYTAGTYESGSNSSSSGAFGLSPNGSGGVDIFLASFNSSFVVQNTASIGSPQNDDTYYMALSASGFRLYMAAYSTGTGFDADPSAGNFIVDDPNLATTGYWMVNSYNTSDLSFNFSVPYDASVALSINQLSTSSYGVDVVMGIQGSVDLDPSAAVVNVNYSSYNGVILNLNPSGGYDHHFAYTGLTGSNFVSFRDVIETPDYYYIPGGYSGTIDFDFNSGSLVKTTPASYSEGFLMRIDRYAPEPTHNSTSLTFSGGTDSTVTVHFPGGDGDDRLLLVKEDGAEDFVPVDKNYYTSISTFGFMPVSGTLDYALYSDTGHMVSVSGLDARHHNYQFAVYQYNVTGGPINYLTTSPARGVYTRLNTAVNNNISSDLTFNVYPNPTIDVLQIDMPDAEAASIRISDINGRIVRELNTNTGSEKIDVSALAAGSYQISLQSATGSYTKRFIKM